MSNRAGHGEATERAVDRDRLAADGRGLQEQTVNNNFATLSEALYIAERSARDEVRARQQIRQKLAVKEMPNLIG